MLYTWYQCTLYIFFLRLYFRLQSWSLSCDHGLKTLDMSSCENNNNDKVVINRHASIVDCPFGSAEYHGRIWGHKRAQRTMQRRKSSVNDSIGQTHRRRTCNKLVARTANARVTMLHLAATTESLRQRTNRAARTFVSPGRRVHTW